MRTKSTNSFDTAPNNCFIERDKMSLNKQGTIIPMSALDTNNLTEILTGLIQVPNFITWLDEGIIDELLERDFFSLTEGQVTLLGRDFIATHSFESD